MNDFLIAHVRKFLMQVWTSSSEMVVIDTLGEAVKQIHARETLQRSLSHDPGDDKHWGCWGSRMHPLWQQQIIQLISKTCKPHAKHLMGIRLAQGMQLTQKISRHERQWKEMSRRRCSRCEAKCEQVDSSSNLQTAVCMELLLERISD